MSVRRLVSAIGLSLSGSAAAQPPKYITLAETQEIAHYPNRRSRLSQTLARIAAASAMGEPPEPPRVSELCTRIST